MKLMQEQKIRELPEYKIQLKMKSISVVKYQLILIIKFIIHFNKASKFNQEHDLSKLSQNLSQSPSQSPQKLIKNKAEKLDLRKMVMKKQIETNFAPTLQQNDDDKSDGQKSGEVSPSSVNTSIPIKQKKKKKMDDSIDSAFAATKSQDNSPKSNQSSPHITSMKSQLNQIPSLDSSNKITQSDYEQKSILEVSQFGQKQFTLEEQDFKQSFSDILPKLFFINGLEKIVFVSILSFLYINPLVQIILIVALLFIKLILFFCKSKQYKNFQHYDAFKVFEHLAIQIVQTIMVLGVVLMENEELLSFSFSIALIFCTLAPVTYSVLRFIIVLIIKGLKQKVKPKILSRKVTPILELQKNIVFQAEVDSTKDHTEQIQIQN